MSQNNNQKPTLRFRSWDELQDLWKTDAGIFATTKDFMWQQWLPTNPRKPRHQYLVIPQAGDVSLQWSKPNFFIKETRRDCFIQIWESVSEQPYFFWLIMDKSNGEQYMDAENRFPSPGDALNAAYEFVEIEIPRERQRIHIERNPYWRFTYGP